jgi:large repetitive protein
MKRLEKFTFTRFILMQDSRARSYRLTSLLFVSALLLISTQSFSQNLAQHNWYFGSTADGIRFNRGTNKPTTVNNQAIPFGTGGSAVATDPATANLLFYTDGARVYDACHLLMPNGSGLGGNSSANQPTVICPVPGQSNKYYIFTNSANYTAGGSINRSVVDLALFGNAIFPAPALGNVEVANKNAAVPGLANRSEAMIVIAHSNGNDYWLITHQNGSSNFMTTLINAATYTSGTFNTIVNSIAGPAGSLPISVSNFSYNHKLRKLAVSTQSADDDAQILNFDPATGNLTFDRYILNTGVGTLTPTTNQWIYDIQWDVKGGQYLYLSRVGGETGFNADVLQYDYQNSNPGTPTTIVTSILTTPIARSFGLQLAPDSAIYHIYQATAGGPFLVDKFTKTDTLAAFVVRTPSPFGATNFSGTQFPSFLPEAKVKLTVDFTVAGTCQDNPVTFFPTVLPNADSLRWDFGDSQSSKAWSPVHKFAQAQTFNVRLRAFYQGRDTTITKPVTISPFTLKIQLVQDTTACRSEFPPPRGTSSPTQFSVTVKVTQGSATSFNWSNGQTGATLKPDSAGYYYVVVKDATGCSTYAGVNVKEYKLNDQRSNIWYFGNKAGIDFNKQPPVALNTSAMDAPAGCAIVCDRNGRAIFYTDGANVYDRTNTLINPGAGMGIGGAPTSTQSSLIVPLPGDETIYYIFTTQEITGTSLYELRYSVFDLKLGSNGQLAKKNVLLFTKSTERITSNGRWIVAHEYGNNTFRAYKITDQGIGEAVYSDIGSIHSFKTAANGQGYMKFGARNNLAVPLSTPGTSNSIELFQLNDTTGVLRNYRKVDLNEPQGQVYGLEFSPSGRKLFASVRNAPSASQSELFEFYLDSLDVKPPVLVPPKVTQTGDIGAIQIAPNSTIYFSFNDAASNKSLGSVNLNDNKIPAPSSYNFNAFPLATGTNTRLGLPNFVQQQGNGFGGPGFTFTGICLGDTTKFNGTPTDAIDVFEWTFKNSAGLVVGGDNSNISNPKILFSAAGTYKALMRLTNRCGLDTTIVQDVKINPPAPRPTNLPAVSLCNGPITLDAGPAVSWSWTGGAITQTITVANPGVFNVTTTDANGCKAKATSFVVNSRPPIDLGPDKEVCQNSVLQVVSNTSPNVYNLSWTLNGAPLGGTTNNQQVDTTVPGVFKYSLTASEPPPPSGNGCTVTDDVTITVKVSPSFTLSLIANPTCSNSTGPNANGSFSFQINSTSPPGGPYSYFISGPSTNDSALDQPPLTLNLTGKGAGTYSAIVTDQVSGCTISNAVALSDASFSITPTATACDPTSITVSLNPGGTPSGSVQFTFISAGPCLGVSPCTTVGPITSSFPFTSSASAGTYSVEARDGGGLGCTAVAVVTTTLPTPPTISSNLCSNPATLSTSAVGTSYKWTFADGTTQVTTSPNVNLPLTARSGTYKVEVTTSGCIVTGTTLLTYNGPLAPTIQQSNNGCANTATLSVTPVGNYTYRWTRNGVAILGGSQISVTTSDDGAAYSVQVVDGIGGCTQTVNITAQVSGIVDASLVADQACDDGKAFTITATSAASPVTYSWFFNNSSTPIAGETTSTLNNQTAVGTYRVRVSKATCFADASVPITRAPLPQGQLIDAVVICADKDNQDPATNNVDLNPGSFTTYNWFKNDLPVGFTKQIFNAASEGTYKVDLTNAFGCSNSDQTKVLDECLPKIVGPNAFRPASTVQFGDKSNREFFVYSFFVSDNFEIAIFNRWGEMVFESKDKNFRWNGGYNNNGGQPLPGGTYSYIIRYQSSYRPQDGTKEQRGGVVLLR